MEIRKYLIQLGFILGLLVLLLIIIFLLSYSILNHSSFNIDNNKNILILGDSHTECAINDNILQRSANFSSSATTYPFSYITLKKIIADNPQIDTLILSISTYTVSNYIDKNWLKGDVLYNKIRIFIPYADFEDIKPFVKDIDFYIALIKSPNLNIYKAIRHLKKPLIEARSHNIGKYRMLDRHKLKTNIRMVGNKYPFMCVIDNSTQQYEYLEKIKTICYKKNIKLILITPPLYMPEKYFDMPQFRLLMNNMFPDVDYIDYSGFSLPNSCYGDIEHLNNEGAKIFSTYLQKKGFTYN